jgi:hypothetical protein
LKSQKAKAPSCSLEFWQSGYVFIEVIGFQSHTKATVVNINIHGRMIENGDTHDILTETTVSREVLKWLSMRGISPRLLAFRWSTMTQQYDVEIADLLSDSSQTVTH